MKASKQGSKMMVVLLVGFLTINGGCPAGPILQKIAVWLGGSLSLTVVGKSIENAIDKIILIFKKAKVKEEGTVEINAKNPLTGIYKGTMRLVKPSGEKIVLQNPVMVRSSVNSSVWGLAPEEKADAVQKFKSPTFPTLE